MPLARAYALALVGLAGHVVEVEAEDHGVRVGDHGVKADVLVKGEHGRVVA